MRAPALLLAVLLAAPVLAQTPTPTFRHMASYYTDASSLYTVGQGGYLAHTDEVLPYHWRKFTGGPSSFAYAVVLDTHSAGSGQFDAGGLQVSTCLQVRSTIYCYYGGYPCIGTQCINTGMQIGLATSQDGGYHFQRWVASNAQCTGLREPFDCCTDVNQGTCANHGNPVLPWTGATFESGGGSCGVPCLASPYVIYDIAEANPARRWKMLYDGIQGYHTQTGYAFSPDGVNWTRYAPVPVFDQQLESWAPSGGNGFLVVVLNNGTWVMWYAPNGDAAGVATAPAPEGPWTRSPSNPILYANHPSGCPHSTDWPLLEDLYPDGAQWRFILGCLDRFGGSGTSHPVAPFYAIANTPNAASWTMDLVHSPLQNAGSPGTFDAVSWGNIRTIRQYLVQPPSTYTPTPTAVVMTPTPGPTCNPFSCGPCPTP